MKVRTTKPNNVELKTMMNDQNMTEEKDIAEKAVSGTEDAVVEEESFKKLFEASLKEAPALKKGENVKGVVVSVDSDAVTLDVGAKNEGTINISEFSAINKLLPAIGDELDAMVLSGGGRGGIRLSILEGRRQELWEKVDAAVAAG